MEDYPTSLFKNKLEDTEEITIIYEGPSFNNKIELNDLRTQLKSTEYLINDIVDELFRNKASPVDSKGIKIYLKLKRGSFAEIISVVLTSPIAEGIVIGCIIGIFNHFLNRKNKGPTKVNIENMTNNFLFAKNVDKIVSPLHQKGDKVKMISEINPKISTEVIFEEQGYIKEYLKELDKSSVYESYEEEFFGYLSRVNIDTDKFGFTLEGSNKKVPVIFVSHLNLRDIRNILGERIRIKAIARYKNKELCKLEIEEYEIKKRKTLKDFIGD